MKEEKMDNLSNGESLLFVSVIIPTYHDWKRLQLCLYALSKQTYPQENFEILVVNNDPEDKAPDNLLLPENCTLLEEEKPGSYAARNKALSVAKGEIYAFTDSDCQPQSDWIEVAVDFFSERPECDRIGGKIELIMSGDKPTWSEIYEKAFAFRQKEFVKVQGMAATGNMVAKKMAFDSTGLFNDGLMSGGDAEWGVRADNKGFKIAFVDSCVVWHPTRSKLSELVQKTRREAGGHYKLNRKKGVRLTFFNITIGLLPPIKSIFKLSSMQELKFKEKVIAFFIRYYLRLVSTFEKVACLFGKKAERI